MARNKNGPKGYGDCDVEKGRLEGEPLLLSGEESL
jgi:hypothetical protein